MSKTEIVTELQTILNDLKGITADLEQNISGLKDFLEDRKFIPKELGVSIREQLEAIDAKQTEIVSKYEMLDVQKPEMQHTAIEENLSEIQKVIEENEKYRKAIAFFLELHADDEKTAETLQNRKDRIVAEQIQLMEGDILKEYAEPYAWLQQAFWEKDARRKFSLIYKLVPHFEEEIVTGIHFNTLKLDENKVEPEESVPEAFCAETDSADREKEETAENTAEVLEESEECPEAWKDLLIPEDSSLLHVQMSAKAGTKFGAKEFRKDMCKQPLTEKMCCLLECIEEHGYSVKSLAEKNDNGYEIYKTATEKLYQSGYLKRYIVDGMGEFFTLSPRGERILYTKEAVGFINQMLKEKISNQDEGEHIEDSTNSAMTRLMAYDSACKQRILFPDYEFDTCNSVFGTDYFMIGYSMNGKKNFQWFAGVVTEDPAELQEFKDVVAEKAGAEESLVVYGVSLEHAKKVASWLQKELGKKAALIYYTSKLEKNVYALENDLPAEPKTGEPVEDEITDESVELPEEEPEQGTAEAEASSKTDSEKEDETDKKTEEAITLELEQPEAVEEQPEQESEESYEAEEKGIVSEQTLTDEKRMEYIAAYQEMIASGKIYAASAYLKALAGKYDAFEQHYRQLAYAMNDPMEHCTYNSDTIFQIFYGESEPVSDYYVVAAALRNYFLDQYSYDYSAQQLYDMFKKSTLLTENQSLEEIVYDLMEFKNRQKRGVDRYADYREKERGEWEKQLAKICHEAKEYYESYKNGNVKESTSHKRFLETTKLLLGADSDLCQYLKAVSEDDREMLEILEEFLADTYVKDQAVICEENIDQAKVNRVMDEFWDRAAENMNSVKKTSDLMGSLRMNFSKKVHKIVSILCDYVSLMQASFNSSDDAALVEYKKIRTPLLHHMDEMIAVLSEKDSGDRKACAGKTVLQQTLKELKSRLSGEYKEGSYQFYYIDFLKNDKVLLDEDALPILDEVFELPDFSVISRIQQHCTEEEHEFADRMQEIFEGEDDYGSVELILKYWKWLDHPLSEEDAEKYDIDRAIVYPLKDLENKRKEFSEDIELAQSYGQIDNTAENGKELILQIVESWYSRAVETRNYGFFGKILKEFREKMKKDAQVRAVDLKRNLDTYLKQNPDWEKEELICEAIAQIKNRIEQQNYAAAEDLLNRVLTQDLDPEFQFKQEDYLEEFLNEYDINYRKTANSGTTLKALMNTPKTNKDIKGGNKLLENWPKGAGTSETTLKVLLSTLGFQLESVQSETPVLGKVENYTVRLKRPENGRKSNYKHPIAAFGSEAEENGFRVICLFGKTDASRLIDTFKEVGNAKHTLVLLDYALPLAERRILARKTKTDLSGKIFAVVDRVVLVYLAKHYTETAMNRMLMAVVMPFASYQPYIHKSVDTMPQEIFIGRKYELEKIESATGVNLVYGGRQLGKSALLRMAKKNIDHDENGDRAVLVDIKDSDYKTAARKISAALFDEGILKEEHITEDWSELARDLKKRLMDTTDKIPYFLLMLDEADKFIESCESVKYEPFDMLKEIQGIGEKRFKFVVAGLRNIVRFKKEATLGKNCVFPHFDSLTVKPFKAMEARELLEVPLSYLGFRFPEDNETEVLISTILGTTNYFPGLLQLYCTKLIEAMQRDYAGYSESETPPYIVKKEHIKKVLAEQTLQEEIRKKFFITLVVGDDSYYYIIALMVAYLYHENKSENGCSADELLELAEGYSIKKIRALGKEQLVALMEEMRELYVLQNTGEGRYRFTRYSFCQMMGTIPQINDELEKYMED